MTLRRRQFLQLTAGAAALPLVPRLAAAQSYPARPMHLIIGFTPGAASDVIGRIFAKNAEPVLGQQFVVENKPGAGSSIAAQYVLRSAADGYTLFIPALSTLTYQIANPDVTFDIRKDFAPVAPLARGTFVLAVNPELKVKSVAELIALAKAKPGQLLFGSVGNGSLPHLCAEMFAQRAGIKMTHVPYPGSPQVITDLVAGRINLTFNIASSALGQIEAKQLIALAVCSNKRSAVLARRADNGGSRCARFRHQPVARAPCAGRDAKAGDRHARRRRQQGDARAGGGRSPGQRELRAARR